MYRAMLLSVAQFAISSVFADNPIAIIGGYVNGYNDPYAAFVFPNGTLTAIPLPLVELGPGEIDSVSINDSGSSIIGGYANDFNDPYAALVSPNGTLTTLSLPAGSGEIYSVSINSSGSAIIGGIVNGFNDPYAALVSPNGTLTALPLSALWGGISGVSINDNGSAIIGGYFNSVPHAALVSPNGTLTSLSPFPAGSGEIYSVSINSSGAAIIGGIANNWSAIYAALVSSNGTLTALPLPAVTGNIYSVSINDSGAAIIGGRDVSNSNSPYAALVAPNGTLTSLSPFPAGSGFINSVSINSSGAAIIGGSVNGFNDPYAALVAPNGTLTPLSPFPAGYEIRSVSINDSGAAIIGGVVGYNDLYAALVAPNGTLTALPLPLVELGYGEIRSVSISNGGSAVLNASVPKSFGPGNAWFNTLLPELNLLSDHLKEQMIPIPFQPIREVASAKDSLPTSCYAKNTPYSFWGGVVGAQVTQDNVLFMPKSKNYIGGALLGFDYQERVRSYDFSIGAAASYAFNYVDLSKSLGHAKINQEFVTAYGTFRGKYFSLEAALWGGFYQIDNVRHTLGGFITSKSDYHGWLLVPHLELNVPFTVKKEWMTVCPLIRIDWANNWQGSIKERGASGFNLVMGDQYTSLLRSEAGLRLFEEAHFEWGRFFLEEKLSYVNKKPFNAQPVSAFFVGAISSFAVETFSTQTQNLAAGQLSAFFVPCRTAYPSGQINYLIEIGSGFLSQTLSIELNKMF